MKEIVKKNKSVEINNVLSDSSDNSSDSENYQKIKDEIKKVKKPKNLGKMLKTIVSKSMKQKDAILSKVKEPFEKLNEEQKLRQELNEKRQQRKIQKMLGYKKYADWDKKNEKKLLKITTRGVVKLFNSIFEFRKKQKEEKEEEEKKVDKKGSNFLMMHNLDPSFNSKLKKQYQEDNDENKD